MSAGAVGSRLLGAAGEQAALDHLERQGYRLLERNWRSGRLELDLVMERRGVLVFVEVKARGPGSLADPADGLNSRKRAALARAAGLFLSERGLWGRPCRMDFVAVRQPAYGAPLAVERHCQDVLDFGAHLAGGWQPW